MTSKKAFKTIGERIQHSRKALNMSQEDLCHLLKTTTKTTISLWETNRNSPGTESFMKLCDIFKCDPYWLYRGDKVREGYLDYEKKNPLLDCIMVTIKELKKLIKDLE